MKTLLLILGGNPERERMCIKACVRAQVGTRASHGRDSNKSTRCEQGGHTKNRRAKIQWPVWMSGPALTEDCLDICVAEGLDLSWLLLDYRALDTLSNFTTLLHEMRSHGFKVVRLATSECHIKRAESIARVVLPSADLLLGDSIIVPPARGEKHESETHVLRDVFRAWAWRILGFDVTFPLIWLFHSDRVRQRDRRVRDYNYRGSNCFLQGTSTNT